jgi:hypothetical protein
LHGYSCALSALASEQIRDVNDRHIELLLMNVLLSAENDLQGYCASLLHYSFQVNGKCVCSIPIYLLKCLCSEYVSNKMCRLQSNLHKTWNFCAPLSKKYYRDKAMFFVNKTPTVHNLPQCDWLPPKTMVLMCVRVCVCVFFSFFSIYSCSPFACLYVSICIRFYYAVSTSNHIGWMFNAFESFVMQSHTTTVIHSYLKTSAFISSCSRCYFFIRFFLSFFPSSFVHAFISERVCTPLQCFYKGYI